MASPLIVVVVVALADSGDEAGRAMARTVQDALADTAVVVVREEARPDDDALLTRLGEDMHANAVAVVHWSDEGHAQLRVYRTAIRAWTTRDVAFGRDDPPGERGRSLGYGIASMVRAGAEEPPAADKPAPPAPPPASSPAPAARAPRWDVELAGQGVIARSTTSGGASLGAGLRIVDRLTIRASIGGRAGTVDAASASTVYARATGGGSWVVAIDRFTFGPRLELGAIRQHASRADSSGGRWSGVVDLRAEGTATILPRVAIVVGLGAELALERVPIRLDGAQVASLAPVRALGSVGVRLGLD